MNALVGYPDSWYRKTSAAKLHAITAPTKGYRGEWATAVCGVAVSVSRDEFESVTAGLKCKRCVRRLGHFERALRTQVPVDSDEKD